MALPWEDTTQQSYAEISAQRRTDWAAHMATMTIPDELKSWVLAMEIKHGAKVGVGLLEAGHELDWLTALMIVRYGEAIMVKDENGQDTQFWPSAFTAEDIARAGRWWRGIDEPAGIRYLEG